MATENQSNAPSPIWIDTDPSVGLPLHDCDDGYALYQALHSRELKIAGVSVSYGNTSAARGLKITQRFWRKFPDATPSLFPGAVAAGDRITAESHSGLTALSSWLEGATEPVTLIALAPATFYAALILKHPHLKSRIKKIIWVAGRVAGERLFFGQRCSYEFHDANFEKDPSAAAILLDSGISLELIPVGLGPKLLVTPQDYKLIRDHGGTAGRWLTRKSWLWLFLWRTCFGLKGAPVFDCLAVLSATRPDLMIRSRCHLRLREGPSTEFHYQVDETAFHQVCLDVLPSAQKRLFHDLIPHSGSTD